MAQQRECRSKQGSAGEDQCETDVWRHMPRCRAECGTENEADNAGPKNQRPKDGEGAVSTVAQLFSAEIRDSEDPAAMPPK